MPRIEAETDATKVECVYLVWTVIDVILPDSEKYSSKTLAAANMAMAIVAKILAETRHLDEHVQEKMFCTILTDTKIGEIYHDLAKEGHAINKAWNEENGQKEE